MKTSNPSQWYSKFKRMPGLENGQKSDFFIEEIDDLSDDEQAKEIANYLLPHENCMIWLKMKIL